MTEETVFSAPPPLPESAACRLCEVPEPKTLEEFISRLTDWREHKMFFAFDGLPRAYMSFPGEPKAESPRRVDWQNDNEPYEVRWVYSVYCLKVVGPHTWAAEAALVQEAWAGFVALRHKYAALYGEDSQPLLVWRRRPELETERGRGKGLPEITQLYMRLCIPGLMLSVEPDFSQDSVIPARFVEVPHG